MAVWLELRCDVRGRRCYSDMNNGPMALAKHSRAKVSLVLRNLETEACLDGWKRTREGLVCPVCAKRKGEG